MHLQCRKDSVVTTVFNQKKLLKEFDLHGIYHMHVMHLYAIFIIKRTSWSWTNENPVLILAS